MNSDEQNLINLTKKMGLGRVREILEKEYNSRDNLAKRFEDLMDINGKYSQKIYEDMVKAKSLNKRFIIPVFDPPNVPSITNLPFKININDTDEWISHLTGRDKVIWEAYNLFLVGHIPVFDIFKSIDILEVIKTEVIKTKTKTKDKYKLVGSGYEGYNPLLNKGGLKKYYQIYGHRMTCIVFDISYYDNNNYLDGVYDYNINTYTNINTNINNTKSGTLEYGDDGYETP